MCIMCIKINLVIYSLAIYARIKKTVRKCTYLNIFCSLYEINIFKIFDKLLPQESDYRIVNILVMRSIFSIVSKYSSKNIPIRNFCTSGDL